MTSLRTAAFSAFTAALFVACGTGNDSDGRAGVLQFDPVVIYGAFADASHVAGMLEAYTRETGVPVTVRTGAAAAMVDDVIANSVSPSADLLWTPTVSGVGRAAEEGALRPLRSTFIVEAVPEWLRDADGYWVSISYKTAVVVYDPDVFQASDLTDYAALAAPRFRKRLCLTTSTNAINQAVIAQMIDTLAVRQAELAVRGWVANLAAPEFDTDDNLLAAIRSGTCGVGVVTSAAFANARRGGVGKEIGVHLPPGAYASAEGVGVARHAQNPDGAAALVEWLLAPAQQTQYAATTQSHPANRRAATAQPADAAIVDHAARRNLATLAWHRDAAIKLAERARYR
ncbi:MAG: extracellular solute-binding protein [Gammaproteobacteria bacterium]|nr:extracellular solute-binding protein [Gammaproteobacteria bacterium]